MLLLLGVFEFPSGPKASWALGTATWAGRTITPIFESKERTTANPRRPPSAPGEALISLTTLPAKRTKGPSPGEGREANQWHSLKPH